MSRRRSRLHECTPCRSIPSVSPCRRQAKIERAQIVLDRSQPGLPGFSGSASPVFGRTPNAGLKSSGMVLIGIWTTEMTEEGQAPSTDSFLPTSKTFSLHINRSLHFQLRCSTNLECHTSKYPQPSSFKHNLKTFYFAAACLISPVLPVTAPPPILPTADTVRITIFYMYASLTTLTVI